MLVSVVTICYNDLSGLQSTIESLRMQTYSNIEHIVVDGGSTDGTRDFLETEFRIPLWSSEADRGRYDAMNKGMARSSGSLVWLMHAGDRFASPRAVEQVVDAFEASITDGNSEFWGYGLARKVRDGRVVGMFGDVPFSRTKYLAGGRPIPHQASFFSADMIKRVGSYSLTHGLGADQEYLMRCLCVRDPLVVADFVCDFDVSGAGSTRTVQAHFRDFSLARRANGLRVHPIWWKSAGVQIYALARAYAGRLGALVA